MITIGEILHLSPSTAQQYKTCSKALYFRKILGIQDKTGYAATQYGSAVHKALEILFREKLKGNKLTSDEFTNVFTKEYERLHKYTTIWKEDTKVHLMTEGKKACEGFHKYWYNRFDPAYVEYEFNVDRGEDKLPIKCIVDMITKDHRVVDWKFGRSAKAGSYMLNMATYAKCYFDIFGTIPEVSIVKQKWSKKRMPNGQYKYWFDGFAEEKLQITQEWFEYYDSVYEDVENGIKSNVFVTASDNNGLCKECWYRKTGDCKVVLLD